MGLNDRSFITLTKLMLLSSHQNSNRTPSWRKRWVYAGTLLDNCKRLNCFSLPTYPVPFLHLPIPASPPPGSKKITTPHIESKALFSANQPNLRLKPVASRQLGTSIRSVTMLRSRVYTTAICLNTGLSNLSVSLGYTGRRRVSCFGQHIKYTNTNKN